jgi:RNA polymerase sigma-70 factor (ECF subfamily)
MSRRTNAARRWVVGVGPSGPASTARLGASNPGIGRVGSMLAFPGVTMSSGSVQASQKPEPSDGAVVRAVLAGQREFFRLLVRRHQDGMYRHVVRMVRSPDDAADLVQRAFVTGFGKLDRCQDPEKVAGWLFRIASNLCKDFLKDRRRQTVSLDDPDVIPIDWNTPGERAERRELRERIGDAVAQLAPEQREAFLLKHVEGHSYDEMAELLDTSVSALKMRVKRAREALQGALEVFR